MRRAWLLVVLAGVGCKTRFDPLGPNTYKCTKPGVAECAAGWVCNVTAGFCVNPDAGISIACASDSECGGGWRCSPNHQCVDRSVEGQLSLLPPFPDLVEASPLLPLAVPLHSSQAVTVARRDATLVASDLVFGDEPHTWLAIEDVLDADGIQTSYGHRELPAGQSLAVTTALGDAGFVHLGWVVDDGGLSAFVMGPGEGLVEVLRGDGGVYVSVTPVRTDVPMGLALLTTQDGPPVIWGAAARSSTPAAANDLAFLCGVAAWSTPQGLLLQGPGPLERWLTDAGVELRATSSVLAWRVGNDIAWGEACGDAGLVVDHVDACPPGSTLQGWNLIERPQQGAVPMRFCDDDVTGQQERFDGFGAKQPVYDPLTLSGEGTWTYTRGGSGAVGRLSPAGDSLDLTLAMPPDALLASPRGLSAALGNQLYVQTKLGFLQVRSWSDPSQAIAATLGNLVAFRSGAVFSDALLPDGGDDGWAVAWSPSQWNLPRAPVLLRSLPLPDGGTLLAVTHDDVIDMAQLKRATRETVALAPAVVPQPGFAVTDVAFAPATDGGFATGYAVAGGALLALSAATPTRWQATRVNLPLDVLHVWFDGAQPRAVLSDGTVLGLTAVVVLTEPTPGPAIAATSVCDSPVVLTDKGVYALTDGGWWPVGNLPLGADLSGGAVFAVDAGVYVFDAFGNAFTTALPSCPR
jgi:hypothetical protein